LFRLKEELRLHGLEDVAGDPRALVEMFKATIFDRQSYALSGIRERLDFALEGGKLPIEVLDGVSVRVDDVDRFNAHPLMGETFEGIASGLGSVADAIDNAARAMNPTPRHVPL
jgi:hypothetical protein